MGRLPYVAAHLRVELIAEARNIVQVSRWLGHHSPSFTLDVYAHLMDEGVGGALAIPAGFPANGGFRDSSHDASPSIGVA